MSPRGFSHRKDSEGDDTVIYKYSNEKLDVEFGTLPIQDFIKVKFLK